MKVKKTEIVLLVGHKGGSIGGYGIEWRTTCLSDASVNPLTKLLDKRILLENTSLYKMIKNGYVPSMLLYGEPGIGKTSLAYAIAGTTKIPFIALNATTSGKKDVEEVVQESRLTGKTDSLSR